ncbi:uncharacterized protein K452DRAFT_297444 [Aplosporella prunicola CBS 121167]|uniref:Uncharacterized protein n=1 Tax=Aplosporella prunicola CBS 121167 TaxID=1176127 RepID=A0A6A6BJD3_9PEZI|nr:uncharacterized protein K452DRAFT_297444 [Aplosporella prunicola CBS 121167]KAF2142927.1 hypothetical protein K452DRAFT_297444 [Aplosporella prunicola CBS 121167]
MSESKHLSARLNFLHKAAHSLALSSPETSSFLQSQYGLLLAENARRREVCNACGIIFIPGWSSHVSQETSKSRKKTKVSKASDNAAPKMTIYTCLRCHSKTPFQAPPAKERLKARKLPHALKEESLPSSSSASGVTAPAAQQQQQQQQQQQPPPPVATSANASSKKRAKTRKQGGLAAMLASSKKPESKGFGLDLMDFMQGP